MSVLSILVGDAAAPAITTPDAGAVIRVILGLVALVVLAYVVGQRWFVAVQSRLGISSLLTAGLPFVFLGLIARQPGVDILTDPVLHNIQPILPLGLGWIGFSLGYRFDVRTMIGLPRELAVIAVLTTAVPLAAIAAGAAVLFLLREGYGEAGFLRNAILLGVAGVIGVRELRPRDHAAEQADPLRRVEQFQELAAIVGLFFLAAFFRPDMDVLGWRLPGIAWVFVTFGLGTGLGLVVYVVLSSFRDNAEITLVVVGSVCLTAGLASVLRLSPVAVCFLAGALAFNLPGEWRGRVANVLEAVERPFYLAFLVVSGALWRIGAWEGWALFAVFVVARLVGKRAATSMLTRGELASLGAADRARLVLAPFSPLAIAVVVNAQDLYSGPVVPWLLTAVIAGAMATEILIHLAPPTEIHLAPPTEGGR
jgi:hypothetical protein